MSDQLSLALGALEVRAINFRKHFRCACDQLSLQSEELEVRSINFCKRTKCVCDKLLSELGERAIKFR